MKKLLLLLIILLTILSCKHPIQLALKPGEVIPDHYIVFMKDAFGLPLIDSLVMGSDTNRLQQKANQQSKRAILINKMKGYFNNNGITVEEKNIFVDVSVGAVLNIKPEKVITLLNDSVNVDTVIQDVNIQINPIQQTDPSLSGDPYQQWLSPPDAGINPIQQDVNLQDRYDINSISHMTDAIFIAGGPVSGAGKPAIIWFLDTGIDPRPGLLNVNTGLGKYFVGTSTNDDNGHGTFCAGVAAGKPVGTATGFEKIHIGVSEGATVVPIKVLDNNGEGTWANVILGLNHVAPLSHAGDIVNLSLGVYEAGNHNCHNPPLKRAIKRLGQAGVFVTMSAGNNAGSANCNMPGCIDGQNIFTISSINPDLSCAEYANFRGPVEYVTVGTRVFSLWDNNEYRMASGTSVSSAIMAGIIHARGTPPPLAPLPGPGVTQNCMGREYTIAKR